MQSRNTLMLDYVGRCCIGNKNRHNPTLMIRTDPEPELLTQKEVAALLGKHRTTMWDWQQRGIGPPTVPIGRRRYYERSKIKAWLAAASDLSSASDASTPTAA